MSSAHNTASQPAQANGAATWRFRSYLRDTLGSLSLVFDLSITHDRICSSCHVHQNRSL